MQPNEIGEIVQGFDNPAGLQSNGLHIQGQKFMLLRADDRSIYGRHDAEGVVCVRTKQTVIIAHYPPTVQAGEATKIVEQLADNPAGLQSNGLHIQGQKFMLLRADDRSIYGRHDAEGVVCVRTKQTVIIAHYPPTVQAGEATKIVEQLADYLIGVQY